jgi:O-antigen/teichoic acid export membrane protein
MIKKWWNKIMEKGHERTVRAKKHILFAVIFKGIGILIGFAYFPLSLTYLGPVKFGIFLTLVSMINWFEELDVGIGNGLRNRLGESIADGDDEAGRGYVSTAYFILGGIFSGVSIVFVGVCFLIPWADWLETDAALNQQIMILTMLMFAAFAIRFVASLVFQIFYALQRIALVDMFSTIGKVAFLLMIFALMYYTEESLLLFGAAKTFTFAAVPLLVGVYYFNTSFKKFKPSLKYVKKSYFKGLFSLGIQFFIIKSAMIVIHSTNNFLIASFVSVKVVPNYEAAYKILSVFLMLFVIITNQLWSANVEAYRKGDMEWMRKTMKSITKVWIGTVVLSLLIVLVSPFIYKVWLRDQIQISMMLTLAVAGSISITTWVNSFNLVINGTGKVRLQMYAWIFASIVNIPLSIFFTQFLGFGIIGVVLGTIVSMIPLAILSPWQVKKLLAKTDKGIWAK